MNVSGVFVWGFCCASKFHIDIGGPLALLSVLFYVFMCVACAAVYLYGEVLFYVLQIFCALLFCYLLRCIFNIRVLQCCFRSLRVPSVPKPTEHTQHTRNAYCIATARMVTCYIIRTLPILLFLKIPCKIRWTNGNCPALGVNSENFYYAP